MYPEIQKQLARAKETNFLDIADCAINNFEGFPAALPELQELHLENNYFHTLEGMPEMPKLVKLFAANNELADFSGCAREYPILMEFNVAHNQISTFAQFPKCPWLKYLDLSHNKFKTLAGFPPTLHLHLVDLHLEGNPIETFAGMEAPGLFTVILRISKETLATLNLGDKERRLVEETIDYPIGQALKALETYLGIKNG